VELGPDLGSSYLVVSGLSEGEEIVTNGTFSVDAAAQLAGKPSMMNTAGGPPPVMSTQFHKSRSLKCRTIRTDRFDLNSQHK
jgi:hypothetical protein